MTDRSDNQDQEDRKTAETTLAEGGTTPLEEVKAELAAPAAAPAQSQSLTLAYGMRISRCNSADCGCGAPMIVLYDENGKAFAGMALEPADADEAALALFEVAEAARAKAEVARKARKH